MTSAAPLNTPHAPLILLIEDEEPIRRFLRVTLETNRFRVKECATAHDGILQAVTPRPALTELFSAAYLSYQLYLHGSLAHALFRPLDEAGHLYLRVFTAMAIGFAGYVLATQGQRRRDGPTRIVASAVPLAQTCGNRRKRSGHECLLHCLSNDRPRPTSTQIVTT